MKKIPTDSRVISFVYDVAIDGGLVGNINTGIFIPLGTIMNVVSAIGLNTTGPGAGKATDVNLVQSGVYLTGSSNGIQYAGNLAAGVLIVNDLYNGFLAPSDGTELIVTIGAATILPDPMVVGQILFTIECWLPRT